MYNQAWHFLSNTVANILWTLYNAYLQSSASNSHSLSDPMTQQDNHCGLIYETLKEEWQSLKEMTGIDRNCEMFSLLMN